MREEPRPLPNSDRDERLYRSYVAMCEKIGITPSNYMDWRKAQDRLFPGH
jgi:hypothetical protein